LLALVFLFRFFRTRERIALVASFLVPLLIVVSIEVSASRVIHGPARGSLAPLHLFAKAGLVDADVPDNVLSDGPDAVLHRALERDAAAIRRLIERAPSDNVARFLTVSYEVFLQYRFAMPERRAVAAEGNLSAALRRVGIYRLRHGWRGYLDLTARHYLGLWLLYDSSHPAYVSAVNDFLKKERPLPFEDMVPDIAKGAASAGWIALIGRPAIAAAGAVTFLLAWVGLFSLFRPDAVSLVWRQAGLLALGLHGYCLLVAMAGVGIPRYLLGVWPYLVVSLGLCVAGCRDWWVLRSGKSG
jgi:hypothetical protein